MGALLVGVLGWFGGFLVASLLARVLALFTVTVVSVALVQSLLDQASGMLSGAGADVLWFSERAGLGVALGAIGGAILLRAVMGLATVNPAR